MANIAFDIPLRETDAVHLISHLRKFSGDKEVYQYQYDQAEKTKNAIKLRISTVAVIQDKLNLGVYARQPIRQGDMIGCYEGDRFDANKEERSTIYIMYLRQYMDTDESAEDDSNFAIDASHTFNWARFMNHSEFGFNCQFSLNEDKIIVTAVRDIAESQQLLVHYGKGYEFNTKLFLHSTHNHLQPSTIINTNKKHYIQYTPENFEELLADTVDTLCEDDYSSVHLTTLCEQLLKNSKLVIQTNALVELSSYFRIANASKSVEFEEVTPLMLACYKGLTENVKGKGADPLRCTLKGGRNSLVFAVLTNVPTEKSKEILELLMKHVRNNSNLDSKDYLVYQHLVFIEGESEIVSPIINEKSKNSSLTFKKKKFFSGKFSNKYLQNVADRLTYPDIIISHVEFTDQFFLTTYQKVVDDLDDRNVNFENLNDEELEENRFIKVKVAIDREKDSKKRLKLLKDIDGKLANESKLDMYTQVFTHCVAYINNDLDHKNKNKANAILSYFKNDILWREKISVFSYALQHVIFWHGRLYKGQKWNSLASLKYLKEKLLDKEYNFIKDRLSEKAQALL